MEEVNTSVNSFVFGGNTGDNEEQPFQLCICEVAEVTPP